MSLGVRVNSFKSERYTNKGYCDEILIPQDAFKNVELAVESSVVDGVENLGKDECVEGKSSQSCHPHLYG